MPASDDLALLIDAAEAAGDIATRFAGQSARKWEKPDGAGPVTEADIAVNDMLFDRLCGARPGYGWLSEESTDNSDRLARARVFVVDPIDGTRSFANGSKTWAHSIAVVENGRPIAAVVYLPMRDRLFSAVSGGGARLNGVTITAGTAADLDSADVLASRPVVEAQNWMGPLPGFKRHYRPSLAYRMALVAQGRFSAMITLRETWEWDVAAGDLILREAGARSSDRHGQDLRFNNARPSVAGVVAGEPDVHAAMLNRLVSMP